MPVGCTVGYSGGYDPGPLSPGAGRPSLRTCPAGGGGGRSLSLFIGIWRRTAAASTGRRWSRWLRLSVPTSRWRRLPPQRWLGCSPDGGVVLAAATWNTRRAAVRAFVSWCADRWPVGADPLASVGPRRQHTDTTRAVPYRDLDELWRRRSVPLREKTLWRMLYETAARASEVLALDVGDLDRPQRRARVVF